MTGYCFNGPPRELSERKLLRGGYSVMVNTAVCGTVNEGSIPSSHPTRTPSFWKVFLYYREIAYYKGFLAHMRAFYHLILSSEVGFLEFVFFRPIQNS